MMQEERRRGALAALAFASTVAVCPGASPAAALTAYKCVVDDRVLYSDRPCNVGQQSTHAFDSHEPLPADRAAADARLRDDQRAAAALQRERLKREEVVPLSRRIEAERARKASICSRLALRARRAREDYEDAGSRDRSQKQVRSRRAEEDRAAACSKR